MAWSGAGYVWGVQSGSSVGAGAGSSVGARAGSSVGAGAGSSPGWGAGAGSVVGSGAGAGSSVGAGVSVSWAVAAKGEMMKLAATVAMIAILRSEELTSELQSLMRISYAVFCFKK